MAKMISMASNVTAIKPKPSRSKLLLRLFLHEMNPLSNTQDIFTRTHTLLMMSVDFLGQL
jgi:hypothetical protein